MPDSSDKLDESKGKAKQKCLNCGHDYYPGNVISFEQYDEVRAQMEKQEQIGELYSAFNSIMSNIIYDQELISKSVAVRQAAEEMASRLDNIAAGESPEHDSKMSSETKEGAGVITILINAVKTLLGKQDKVIAEQPKEDKDILFFKGRDGVTRWVARYSNNIRDDDNPSEIISSASHQKFAALVDEGLVKPPDLWLWHEPDWKWGVGEWAAYDDTGFALSGGIVYKEAEPLAFLLADAGDVIGVSHGMPPWSVRRDLEDGSIITEHITEEVSPLPLWAAANKLTQFTITKETDNMAISKEVKARLLEDYGVTPDLIATLEGLNTQDAQKAVSAGRQSKEVAEAVEATEQPVAEAIAVTEVVEAEAAPVDDEIKSVLKSIMEAVIVLNQKQENLTKEIAALKATDEQKIAKQAATSPLSTLAAAMAQSVVGSEAARVDGRTSLAKSGPAEYQPAVPQVSPFSWLNEMVAQEAK